MILALIELQKPYEFYTREILDSLSFCSQGALVFLTIHTG